jgi:hypothetical protein
LGQKIPQEIQRRRIEPLQVIQEQCERMFWPRKHSDKTAED